MKHVPILDPTDEPTKGTTESWIDLIGLNDLLDSLILRKMHQKHAGSSKRPRPGYSFWIW